MTCLVYSFTRQLVTIKTNDFVKPKDQREFIRFGLARNRTFKNDFVKPKDQREFIRFGLARNRTFKNKSFVLCL